ncbi:APC family permease [Candidatus Nitrospira allomarina]|uniref:Amino acid permease n=1 Tax=Candidatus Nitrospira allomarina TaxID=3020900 RepID=A0AA96GJG3_9BACT|nr:amino acid permease [Candidatus Nitrospira allomarina]WNM60063.1 amino acid permease [Candidatus Nitrospira allomarina]
MTEEPPQQTNSPKSVHRISMFTATCVLVSNVVGTGVFTTTGFMARDIGDPWLILLVWGAGALLALTGAMCYSELGAAFPFVGGDYVYLREAYHPFFAFLSGWASFTVGFGAAIAAGAMGFASYVVQLIPYEPASTFLIKGFALGLIWSLTAVHVAGVGPGGLLQQLFTVLKVGAILLLIVGAFTVGHGDWEHLVVPPRKPDVGLGTLVVSFIFVTYAYSGWNAAGYIAGEILNPTRSIPRTMIGGTLLVGTVYVVLNVVYFYALPIQALAAPPLMPVAEKVAVGMFGQAAAEFVTIMLCISIAGAVSAMIWTGPRVYYAMARDGFLPAFFSDTEHHHGTPVRSIVLQSLWVTVLVLLGTFEQLVIYSGMVITAFTALTVGAVIILRQRRPQLVRPYRVPFYPVLPVGYILVAGVIMLFLSVEKPVETLWACLTLSAGIPLYFLMRKHNGVSGAR